MELEFKCLVAKLRLKNLFIIKINFTDLNKIFLSISYLIKTLISTCRSLIINNKTKSQTKLIHLSKIELQLFFFY